MLQCCLRLSMIWILRDCLRIAYSSNTFSKYFAVFVRWLSPRAQPTRLRSHIKRWHVRVCPYAMKTKCWKQTEGEWADRRTESAIDEGSTQGDSINLVCSDLMRNLIIFQRGDHPFVTSIMLYWRTRIIRDVGSSDVAGHGQECIPTFERVGSEIVMTEVHYFSMLWKIVSRPPPVGEVYRLWCTILCTPYFLFSRPTRPRRATKINIIRHCHYYVIFESLQWRRDTEQFIPLRWPTVSFLSIQRIDSNHFCYDSTQPGASLGEQT